MPCRFAIGDLNLCEAIVCFTALKRRLISDCGVIILPQNRGISKSFYGAYDPNQSSNEKPICASLDASGSLSMRSGKAGSRA
jgi:hypothetical protein